MGHLCFEETNGELMAYVALNFTQRERAEREREGEGERVGWEERDASKWTI